MIVEGSKILAQYLGYTYLPFNNENNISHNPGWWLLEKRKNINIPVLPKSKWVIMKDKNYKGKFICRGHNELEFYNNYNQLFQIITKLEKEDLSEYFYSWYEGDEKRNNFEGIEVSRFHGAWDVSINLALDPCMEISEIRRDKEDKEQLFLALVDAIKYINNLKNNGKG